MKGMLNLAGIEVDSVVDGPGLRTAVFVQGCDHHCPGCHNPEAQGIGGYFTSIEDLADELTEGRSTLRLTLSGGEPMLQASKLLCLINAIKDRDVKLDVWCYTGFTWEQVQANRTMKALANKCDVLVDGRFILEKKDAGLLFRGSSNQRLIDVASSKKAGEVVEWKGNE